MTLRTTTDYFFTVMDWDTTHWIWYTD